MEEYPLLTRFCYTAEDLHEAYGLSLEGVLPKDLNDDDLPADQWLSVFKHKYQKNSKIYLNHVQPHLVDDCRLLYHKVYQAPPSCGEITSKFARCYAFERCHAAVKNPRAHKVAWALFGESVLNMCSSRVGGLDRKVETWRRANGASHGGFPHHDKKPRMTQSGSNICTEREHPYPGPDYIADLQAVLDRMPWKNIAATSRLTALRANIQQKKETLLRYEGSDAVAKRIKDDIVGYEVRLVELRQQSPVCDDEIREVEADLAASRRMLLRLTVSDNIQMLEDEVQKEQVFKLTFLIVFETFVIFYNVASFDSLGHFTFRVLSLF